MPQPMTPQTQITPRWWQYLKFFFENSRAKTEHAIYLFAPKWIYNYLYTVIHVKARTSINYCNHHDCVYKIPKCMTMEVPFIWLLLVFPLIFLLLLFFFLISRDQNWHEMETQMKLPFSTLLHFKRGKVTHVPCRSIRKEKITSPWWLVFHVFLVGWNISWQIRPWYNQGPDVKCLTFSWFMYYVWLKVIFDKAWQILSV